MRDIKNIPLCELSDDELLEAFKLHFKGGPTGDMMDASKYTNKRPKHCASPANTLQTPTGVGQ